jgi:Lon protease-like protein
VDIPLFPLRTVLCPGIALPLHIFEPRYRLMTERCVADSTPFGIVLIREGREAGTGEVTIASIGTFAEIREVGQYPDGRFDLLVVGAGRFVVQEVDRAREPYLVATVTPLDDELGDPVLTTQVAARTMRRFVAYLQLLQPMEGESAEEIDVRVEIETEIAEDPEAEPPIDLDPDVESGLATAGPEPEVRPTEERAAELDAAARRLVIPEDPTVLSYLLSGIIQVEPRRRQALLEADTTLERLVLLDELIDRELWMLRRRLRHYVPDDEHAVVRRN